MEIVAFEQWGEVRTALTRFLDEERHTALEGLPVWWQLDIDGVARRAVLFSSGTGASGLLASLVLGDEIPHGTSTECTTH